MALQQIEELHSPYQEQPSYRTIILQNISDACSRNQIVRVLHYHFHDTDSS